MFLSILQLFNNIYYLDPAFICGSEDAAREAIIKRIQRTKDDILVLLNNNSCLSSEDSVQILEPDNTRRMIRIMDYECKEGEIDMLTLTDRMKEEYRKNEVELAKQLRKLIETRKGRDDTLQKEKRKKEKSQKQKPNNASTPNREKKAASTLSSFKLGSSEMCEGNDVLLEGCIGKKSDKDIELVIDDLKEEKKTEEDEKENVEEKVEEKTKEFEKEKVEEKVKDKTEEDENEKVEEKVVDKTEEDENEKVEKNIEEKGKETVEKKEDNSGVCAEPEPTEKTEENKGKTEEGKKKEKENEELQDDKEEREGGEEEEGDVKKNLNFFSDQDARDLELLKKVQLIHKAVQDSKMDTEQFFLHDQYFDNSQNETVGPVTVLLMGVHHLEPKDQDCQHNKLFNGDEEVFGLLQEYCGALPELHPMNIMSWGSDEHSSGCSSKIVLHRKDWIEIPSFLDPHSTETPKLKAEIQALHREKKKLVLDLDTVKDSVILYL